MLAGILLPTFHKQCTSMVCLCCRTLKCFFNLSDKRNNKNGFIWIIAFQKS